jgi:hypothetical protein
LKLGFGLLKQVWMKIPEGAKSLRRIFYIASSVLKIAATEHFASVAKHFFEYIFA